MTAIVFDASAVIALLKREPGGPMVASVIGGGLICAVNLAEIVSHFVHVGMPAGALDALLAPLPLRVIDADAALAWAAGALRRVTARAGLSLGDHFCLALAAREGARVYTADRQWRAVADDVGVEVVLIR